MICGFIGFQSNVLLFFHFPMKHTILVLLMFLVRIQELNKFKAFKTLVASQFLEVNYY
jgi:hypothetical protein